jgi:hypothetical protein
LADQSLRTTLRTQDDSVRAEAALALDIAWSSDRTRARERRAARLDLRTTKIPRRVLGNVFAPLAAALLSARYDALQFNQALARHVAAPNRS